MRLCLQETKPCEIMAEIGNYVNNTKQFRTVIQRLIIHRTCEWLVNEELRMVGKQYGHSAGSEFSWRLKFYGGFLGHDTPEGCPHATLLPTEVSKRS
jgi:hypothetical protein